MPWERVYDPASATHNALNAAEETSVTRDIMAEFYADCLRAGRDCDYKAINAAILKRWPKGLNYIKTRAWKLAQKGK
jgi:hypothetical protein